MRIQVSLTFPMRISAGKRCVSCADQMRIFPAGLYPLVADPRRGQTSDDVEFSQVV